MKCVKSDCIQPIIMIVDDEPENLNVLGEMLSGAGMGVRALPDGALALDAARAELPDLVLLDIQMRGMDGYEVCRRFKEDEALCGIPIIFLSSFSEASDKLRAFDCGGVDYVTKPFADVEVLARIGTHLQLRRHQLHLEDLVEQRVMELREAHRRLQIWDDAKNQWLNVLSHEMRTPLNGVIGIAEILFMDLADESPYQDLRPEYDASCQRIEKLMDDALVLARIHVEQEGFARTSVHLRQVLQSAVDEVASQSDAQTIHADMNALDDVSVNGELALLVRAFTDLLFTAGHCVVSGEVVTVVAHVDAGHAHVDMITQGASLSASAIETFFEIGGQREILKAAGDYGLGAALASRIIRLFHGRVSISNGASRGFVIRVSFPKEASHPQLEHRF